MKRVAGQRRTRAVPPSSELPFVRVYAPNTVELTDEVAAMWRAQVGDLTDRKWLLARENDMFVRLYLMPESRHA